MGSSFSGPINYMPVERWTTVEDVLARARKGDLIEFKRTGGLYGHWAVYVGDGYVINYGRKTPRTSLVQKEKLSAVSDGDACRINNLENAAEKENLRPSSPEVIVRRAEDRVGEESDYDVLSHNCECFATECRYGRGFTCQPTEGLIAAGHIAGGGGALAYEAGKRAVADGRWTEEEVADYLYDSWSQSY